MGWAVGQAAAKHRDFPGHSEVSCAWSPKHCDFPGHSEAGRAWSPRLQQEAGRVGYFLLFEHGARRCGNEWNGWKGWTKWRKWRAWTRWKRKRQRRGRWCWCRRRLVLFFMEMRLRLLHEELVAKCQLGDVDEIDDRYRSDGHFNRQHLRGSSQRLQRNLSARACESTQTRRRGYGNYP